jgi:hypothetical protein
MMDGQQDWVCLGPPVLLRSPQAGKKGHPGGPDHRGKTAADGTSSAAEACHDPGTIHLHVQPIGIEVRRVGTPRSIFWTSRAPAVLRAFSANSGE